VRRSVVPCHHHNGAEDFFGWRGEVKIVLWRTEANFVQRVALFFRGAYLMGEGDICLLCVPSPRPCRLFLFTILSHLSLLCAPPFFIFFVHDTLSSPTSLCSSIFFVHDTLSSPTPLCSSFFLFTILSHLPLLCLHLFFVHDTLSSPTSLCSSFLTPPDK
jgi:hypothetical protein